MKQDQIRVALDKATELEMAYRKLQCDLSDAKHELLQALLETGRFECLSVNMAKVRQIFGR